MIRRLIIVFAVFATVQLVVACNNGGVTDTKVSQREAEAQVREVLLKTLKAIEAKDPVRMGSFFSGTTLSKSFGHPFTGDGVSGRKALVLAAKQTFEHIREIQVIPEEKMSVALSGKTGSFALRGKNIVVDTAGVKREAAWIWTGTVGLSSDKQWLIESDHLSFPNIRGQSLTTEELESRAVCCLANLQVSVQMPDLNLRMTTDEPVLMKSRVNTIPPVGYTATVSVGSSRLIAANGRPVGRIESARVNFRETVAHVPMKWDPNVRVVWDPESERFETVALAAVRE